MEEGKEDCIVCKVLYAFMNAPDVGCAVLLSSHGAVDGGVVVHTGGTMMAGFSRKVPILFSRAQSGTRLRKIACARFLSNRTFVVRPAITHSVDCSTPSKAITQLLD